MGRPGEDGYTCVDPVECLDGLGVKLGPAGAQHALLRAGLASLVGRGLHRGCDRYACHKQSVSGRLLGCERSHLLPALCDLCFKAADVASSSMKLIARGSLPAVAEARLKRLCRTKPGADLHSAAAGAVF